MPTYLEALSDFDPDEDEITVIAPTENQEPQEIGHVTEYDRETERFWFKLNEGSENLIISDKNLAEDTEVETYREVLTKIEQSERKKNAIKNDNDEEQFPIMGYMIDSIKTGNDEATIHLRF